MIIIFTTVVTLKRLNVGTKLGLNKFMKMLKFSTNI